LKAPSYEIVRHSGGQRAAEEENDETNHP